MSEAVFQLVRVSGRRCFQGAAAVTVETAGGKPAVRNASAHSRPEARAGGRSQKLPANRLLQCLARHGSRRFTSPASRHGHTGNLRSLAGSVTHTRRSDLWPGIQTVANRQSVNACRFIGAKHSTGGDESAQRQDPCRGETAGTNGNADGRNTKPVTQGQSQVDAADQGQRCHDADGKHSDSGPGPDRKRGK